MLELLNTIEYKSILKRLVGADIKDSLSSDDRLLVVDANDADRLKVTKVGNFPYPPTLPESFFRLPLIGDNQTLPTGSFGFRLNGSSLTEVTLNGSSYVTLILNHADHSIIINKGTKQDILDLHDVNTNSYVIPAFSATLFIDVANHWAIIPLTWNLPS